MYQLDSLRQTPSVANFVRATFAHKGKGKKPRTRS